jgi:hypothetical protein
VNLPECSSAQEMQSRELDIRKPSISRLRPVQANCSFGPKAWWKGMCQDSAQTLAMETSGYRTNANSDGKDSHRGPSASHQSFHNLVEEPLCTVCFAPKQNTALTLYMAFQNWEPGRWESTKWSESQRYLLFGISAHMPCSPTYSFQIHLTIKKMFMILVSMMPSPPRPLAYTPRSNTSSDIFVSGRLPPRRIWLGAYQKFCVPPYQGGSCSWRAKGGCKGRN